MARQHSRPDNTPGCMGMVKPGALKPVVSVVFPKNPQLVGALFQVKPRNINYNDATKTLRNNINHSEIVI